MPKAKTKRTKKKTTTVVKAKKYFTKVEPGERYIERDGKSYHVCIKEVQNLVDTTKKRCKKKRVLRPFKKVSRLLLQRKGEEDMEYYRYPLDPVAAINGTLESLTPGSMWSVNIDYWDPRIAEEVDDYTGTKHIWVGSERQYGDDCRYWRRDNYSNITEVMLGSKKTNAIGILQMGANGFGAYRFDNGMHDMEIPTDKIIIDQNLWCEMSKELREQFLRNVYADEVYIKRRRLVEE